jgi:predicted ester cyclase
MEKSHADLFQRFPDLKIVTTRVLLNGDVAAWEWSTNGTDTVGMKDEKPTGKPFGFNAVSVMWFDDDGLVKQDWTYFDGATIASQLGKMPKEMKARPIPTLPSGDATWVEAKGDGKEAKNAETTKAFYATFAKKDDKGFLGFLDDNAVHSDQTAPVDLTGKDAAKREIEGFRKAFPDMKLTPDYQWPMGDYVVAVGTMTGTNKGALPPMVPRATGKALNFHFVDIFELRDGKIVRAVSYGNGNEIAGQLGLLPKVKEPAKEKGAPATEPPKDKAAPVAKDKAPPAAKDKAAPAPKDKAASAAKDKAPPASKEMVAPASMKAK